ncbi:MAG: hypothetical protein PGN13_01585 [Patulibacter minatonensis]
MVDTAFALRAGEALVVLDPLVRSGGPVTDLEPLQTPGGAGRVRTGDAVGLEPAGSVVLEPDADADGWGDTSQDLCPGVAGPACGAGASTVSLSGPSYVPALDDVRATWTVTNTSPTPQPFVLNLYSPTLEDRFEGPPGMRCRPRAARERVAGAHPDAAALPRSSPATTSGPSKRTCTRRSSRRTPG